MTYGTLMAHLRVGRSNAAVLQVAATLAWRFGARVIGVAACRPDDIVYGEASLAGTVLDRGLVEMEKELAATEAEFRSALHDRAADTEWRSTMTYALLPECLSHEARCADLIITAATPDRPWQEHARHVDTGDLVMQAGRPVLIVPEGVEALALDHAVICWKDTREARRAVVDALPLLQAAQRVTVVEVASAEDSEMTRQHLDDVVVWLKRHGVQASGLSPQAERNGKGVLAAIIETQESDLIVAGAYGHSRVREWAFGGVTRDILMQPRCCALVSH